LTVLCFTSSAGAQPWEYLPGVEFEGALALAADLAEVPRQRQ
jgi:hypothetical protein